MYSFFCFDVDFFNHFTLKLLKFRKNPETCKKFRMSENCALGHRSDKCNISTTILHLELERQFAWDILYAKPPSISTTLFLRKSLGGSAGAALLFSDTSCGSRLSCEMAHDDTKHFLSTKCMSVNVQVLGSDRSRAQDPEKTQSDRGVFRTQTRTLCFTWFQ